MTTISYTEAREQLATVWDRSVATREPIIISRRGVESVVMLPLDEWEGMQETAHLLRSPTNARRLLSALLRFEAGEEEKMTTEELASRIGSA
jgi:antitoxin YefM